MVTPTFARPNEVEGLLDNLSAQNHVPDELILVDGADFDDRRIESLLRACPDLPFRVHHLRAKGGAAMQRNSGIEHAGGRFIALIDDDIRLDPQFFDRILETFDHDSSGKVGAIAGCLVKDQARSPRQLRYLAYRLLGIMTTSTPGAYDMGSGHPVPRTLSDPGKRLRAVDVVGAGCTVWRRSVFDTGIRFSPFFRTFSYNEDFHLAMVAGRRWSIFDLGASRYVHLKASGGRAIPRLEARHFVINSRFVFVDLVPRRSRRQEARFWLVHAMSFAGRIVLAVTYRGEWEEVLGQVEGMRSAHRKWPGRATTSSVSDRSDEI